MLIEQSEQVLQQSMLNHCNINVENDTNNLDRLLMSLSAFSIQGKRNHMEDYFDIGYQMKSSDQRRPNEWPYEFFYLGIFDGHGGHEAASFAKQNLVKLITEEKDFWSTNDEDVMRAIRTGYAKCHSAMRLAMPEWTRTSKVLPSTAGTTASVLFIRNGKFYTGHVGDSRIVISEQNPETDNWISRQLTQDHKPESETETNRIQRAGGEVKSKIGVYRVVWRRPVLNNEMESKLTLGPNSAEYNNCLDSMATYPLSESLIGSYQVIPFLAIARSLGDFWSINPYSGQYVVSPEPDVSCRPIKSTDKCIILATDGLWNVMNSTHACRILQELHTLKNSKRQFSEQGYYVTDNYYDVAGTDSKNHAQSLVYIAYQIWERKRLRSDNITVVCAVLHDILAPMLAAFSDLNVDCSDDVHVDQNQETLKSPSSIKYSARNKTLVQIGQTSSFLERITLNQEPSFELPETELSLSKMNRLENFLILPPTLLEMESDSKYPNLVYPLNYMRLSSAQCRKITRRSYSTDSFIYIKEMSDDPADYLSEPTRVSKSGKLVKDASAQATQSIHDFGQPWDELLEKSANQEPEEIEDDWDKSVDDFHQKIRDAKEVQMYRRDPKTRELIPIKPGDEPHHDDDEDVDEPLEFVWKLKGSNAKDGKEADNEFEETEYLTFKMSFNNGHDDEEDEDVDIPIDDHVEDEDESDFFDSDAEESGEELVFLHELKPHELERLKAKRIRRRREWEERKKLKAKLKEKEAKLKGEESDFYSDEEESDEELVFEHEMKPHELGALETKKIRRRKELEEQKKLKMKPKEEKTIPQLRCLLNCTPPLRRSTRKSQQSVSDNAKRKVSGNLNAPALPKTKRRKSQPGRCNNINA